MVSAWPDGTFILEVIMLPFIYEWRIFGDLLALLDIADLRG